MAWTKSRRRAAGHVPLGATPEGVRPDQELKRRQFHPAPRAACQKAVAIRGRAPLEPAPWADLGERGIA